MRGVDGGRPRRQRQLGREVTADSAPGIVRLNANLSATCLRGHQSNGSDGTQMTSTRLGHADNTGAGKTSECNAQCGGNPLWVKQHMEV